MLQGQLDCCNLSEMNTVATFFYQFLRINKLMYVFLAFNI